MPVSDMRALRTLYAPKNLRNLSRQRLPSPPTSLSCKSPENPKLSRHFPKRTFHSTNHRQFPDESSLYPRTNESNSKNKTNRSVYTVYDPVSGRLVTKRGVIPNDGDNRDEDRPNSSNSEHEDGSNRTHGSVKRENFVGVTGSRKKGKVKVHWVCSSCGHSDGQWWGSCRECDKAGTLQKFVEGDSAGGRTNGFELSENVVKSSWLPQQSGEVVPLRLTDVHRGMNQLNWRIPLPGLFGNEVTRVLGGGLVPGSLVLVGGDPGVGKSTLLLQIAAIIAEGLGYGEPAPVVYVSGEESVEQIGNRAGRLEIGTEDLFLYSSTDIEDIMEKIQNLSPRVLIVDSIQTVHLRGVTGSPGGIFQVKECTFALLRFAKKTNIPVLLIGHVNKSGDIAGPRVLEHIVDVVLYMEGEKHSSHRLLRSVKNRFGSTDELGVFEMSPSGLQAVSNPSEMFLSEQQPDSECLAGLAVTVIMDGSRAFLIEIQSSCVGVMCPWLSNLKASKWHST